MVKGNFEGHVCLLYFIIKFVTKSMFQSSVIYMDLLLRKNFSVKYVKDLPKYPNLSACIYLFNIFL